MYSQQLLVATIVCVVGCDSTPYRATSFANEIGAVLAKDSRFTDVSVHYYGKGVVHVAGRVASQSDHDALEQLISQMKTPEGLVVSVSPVIDAPSTP